MTRYLLISLLCLTFTSCWEEETDDIEQGAAILSDYVAEYGLYACEEDSDCPNEQCRMISCNQKAHTCRGMPLTGSCDDNNACTKNDRCEDGHCRGEPIVCIITNDNPCVVHYCDKSWGCTYETRTLQGSQCLRTNCFGEEVWGNCQGGICQGGITQPSEAVCDDNIDNDNDGLRDCADPDCEFWPNCAPDDGLENNSPITALKTDIIPGNSNVYQGVISWDLDDYFAISVCNRLRIDVLVIPRCLDDDAGKCSIRPDLDLYLVDFRNNVITVDWSDAGIARLAWISDREDWVLLVVHTENFTWQRYNLYVQIASIDESQTYQPEKLCAADKDSDHDGLIGCDDPDCWQMPWCADGMVEIICNDEVDNDDDGLVDCDDPDCFYFCNWPDRPFYYSAEKK